MDAGIAAVIEAAREGDAIITLGAGSISQAGERFSSSSGVKRKCRRRRIRRRTPFLHEKRWIAHGRFSWFAVLLVASLYRLPSSGAISDSRSAL